jgi:hypothetical protein
MAAIDLDAALSDATSPLVLLVDGTYPGVDLAALPTRKSLVVIQIGDEGRFADVRLQTLDVERIVETIRHFCRRLVGGQPVSRLCRLSVKHLWGLHPVFARPPAGAGKRWAQ